MSLRTLLNKRVVFVSGKGGVGKTTVAVLLGLLAAERQHETLIVEMNSTSRVAPIFGKTSKPHETVSLAPRLSSINLTPQSSFEEFVIKQVRLKILYNTFFNNSYVNNFVGAVPGLSDLLMLGKIYDLERQTRGLLSSKPLYDLILVDAPATGHGLSMLEVPSVVESVVRVGPMYRSAHEMQVLFSNPDKTLFCLVTLAEEMPVIETLEYAQALRAKAHVTLGPLFVNAIMPNVGDVKGLEKLPEDLDAYRAYHSLTRRRAQLNAEYVQDIEKRFSGMEKLQLPFVFRPMETPGDFEELMTILRKA